MLKNLRYIIFLFLSFIFFSIGTNLDAYAQPYTIKIMAYNTFEYQSSLSVSRKTALYNVINPIDPDILVGVEIKDDLTIADNFRTTVLNSTVSGKYSLGTQPSPTDAYGNANGKFSNFLYYKPGKFNFISASIVAESGKWPTLVYQLYHISSGNTIIIFGVHMTSGSTSEPQRLAEATAIRDITDTYSSSVYFMAVGDFNLVTSSSENAYAKLLNQTTPGYFLDPGGFTTPYLTYTTSSLDDRYDMILNSSSVISGGYVTYNSGSFTVAGNSSGTTTTPYTTASDHLPVYATYEIVDNPFPVELESFSCKLNDNRVNLIWNTATEVNNYGFYIERSSSLPGTNWETIGFVTGNGNSNSPKFYEYTDKDIKRSDTYNYRLKQTDNDGTFEYSKVVSVDVSMPGGYYLSQNYPNPFNPETKIDFTIPEKQMITLRVYNTLGEQVAELLNEEKDAGNYSVSFDASNLPSGIYFYRLVTQGAVLNKKMTLLR